MSTETEQGTEPQGNGAAIVVDDPSSYLEDAGFDFSQMEEAGFLTPVAPLHQIRAYFDYTQKVYAAILDDRDFLYTVSITEQGKKRELAYTSLEHAKKTAETYGADIKASPKKSGIAKLAVALGIEVKRTKTTGLPYEPASRHSFVEMIALHKKTGRTAEGIGWADLDEKGGHMSRHDAIATADTRAYNRAILRLSGFGDVSAEEILSVDLLERGIDGEMPNARNRGDEGRRQQQGQPTQQQGQGQRQNQQQSTAPGLPEKTSAEVMASATTWAEHVLKRAQGERFVPNARQGDKEPRELRGRARAGDATSAAKLGDLGYQWSGPADNATGGRFFVEQAPVDLGALGRRLTTESSSPEQGTSSQGTGQEAATQPGQPGWDLSGKGAAQDDKGTQQQSAGTTPMPSSDTIPSSMAKTLTDAILGKIKTREEAQAWLHENFGVRRSIEMTPTQFAEAMKRIKEYEPPKAEEKAEG